MTGDTDFCHRPAYLKLHMWTAPHPDTVFEENRHMELTIVWPLATPGDGRMSFGISKIGYGCRRE